MQYSLADIYLVRDSNKYEPSSNVKKLLQVLESQLIIPTDMATSHTSTAGSASSKYNTVKKEDRQHKRNNTNDPDWKSVRVAFKPTKISSPKDDAEKNINEIRTYLNKLSTKNYQEQKQLILNFIKSNISPTKDGLTPIANFVFDVASVNKFYSELYADLYKEMIDSFDVFEELLSEFILGYKSSTSIMEYKDANKDYDGYCKYVKENDKRKAIAAFLVMLTNKQVLTTEIYKDILCYFHEAFMTNIREENKNNESDELSEILFILLSTIQLSLLDRSNIELQKVFETIQDISKFSIKDKTYPSLTSRAIFKHLDIVDILNKDK